MNKRFSSKARRSLGRYAHRSINSLNGTEAANCNQLTWPHRYQSDSKCGRKITVTSLVSPGKTVMPASLLFNNDIRRPCPRFRRFSHIFLHFACRASTRHCLRTLPGLTSVTTDNDGCHSRAANRRERRGHCPSTSNPIMSLKSHSDGCLSCELFL